MRIDEGITLHVVGYHSDEDQAYLARSLDFDLLGHGDTPLEAVECLKGAIDTYLEFTQRKGIPPFRRAPEEYWELYHQAAARKLRNEPARPGEPLPYALAV